MAKYEPPPLKLPGAIKEDYITATQFLPNLCVPEIPSQQIYSPAFTRIPAYKQHCKSVTSPLFLNFDGCCLFLPPKFI